MNPNLKIKCEVCHAPAAFPWLVRSPYVCVECQDSHHVYEATHTGWLLFCPLWLADWEGDVVPIPRRVPDWWFDFNFWLNDWLQELVALVNPDAVGYLFWRVRPMKKAKTIYVRAE